MAEDHARSVQLSLEYAPQPPFDSGTPDRAGLAATAAVERRSRALLPNRDDDLRALAVRRGFSPAGGKI